MVSPEVVEAIEAELEQGHPGSWRRLASEEMRSGALPLFIAAWRLEVSAGAVCPPEVDHVLLAFDAAFPHSQPRVLAPALGGEFRWPHVELYGLLCLRPTSITGAIGDRVRLHLRYALELLNFSEEECVAEFAREFGAYWAQQANPSSEGQRVVSLVKPGGTSRQVTFFLDGKRSRLVVADTKGEAKAWLRSTGTNVGDHYLQPALLIRLKKPWLPREFPKTVGDAIRNLPDEAVRATLLPNQKSLFLFEAPTPTGPVFAAVLASGARSEKIMHGFRNWAQVPVTHIKRSMAQQRVERVVVSRADAPWIHGRGHSSELADLRVRKVAIVGCGAVGSEVAELLTKAGVGELMLIDNDRLETANVGRHLLGVDYLGWNKAVAVAAELQRRMPHLKVAGTYQHKFERLTAAEREKLAGMDMIVTAGIDIEGEAAVNAWRRTLERPPAYISAWVEAYAIVGHAVLLYGKHDLLSRFEGESPAFRLTDWPESARALIFEAGCGNVFQPHGAVDLQPTIAMAARLALDALLGRTPSSCRRVWFGDQEAVGALGGVVRPDFTETNAMRQIPW